MNCNGVSFEATLALKDVQNVAREYGTEITLILNTEGTIDRDNWGSVKNHIKPTTDRKQVYANPVNFSPTTKIKDNLGIKEDTDIIAHTPMQDWFDLGFTTITDVINQIDLILSEVIIYNTTYELVDKNFRGQYGQGIYLYLILGLNKK